MALKIVIDGIQMLRDRIIFAKIDLNEIHFIGDPVGKLGPYTILVVSECEINNQAKSITFNPTNAQILNAGYTNEAIIIDANEQKLLEKNASYPFITTDNLVKGDQDFISKLSPELKELGENFIIAVREGIKGRLQFYPKSSKFVEKPDNFWTVKIQPRDKSLRITVRGIPENFPSTSSIKLKPDMSSYSSFKISSQDQIPEAVQIIQHARAA